MKQFPLILFFLSILGCATAPVYHGPSSSEPNAVIRFQSLEGLSGVGSCAVCLEGINAKRASFWRLSDTTRLAPGKNVITVMGIPSDVRTKAYTNIVLDVKAGEKYLVKREVEMENIHFLIYDSAGNVVAEGRGKKKPATASFQEIPYIMYN